VSAVRLSCIGSPPTLWFADALRHTSFATSTLWRWLASAFP
jgi:hypothetical protein